MQSRYLRFGVSFALLFMFAYTIQAKTLTTCSAQGSCPVPAATGTQPDPPELTTVFEKAGNNRLNWQEAPALPGVAKGAPPDEFIGPHVPCVLLKAIGAVETQQTLGSTEFDGWKQFNANYGETGTTVISFDCGYGVMQITSGMDGSLNFKPDRVAAEPTYNMGTAAKILIQKWNAIAQVVGSNNPYITEHWYFAVWAYNSLSPVNHPKNPLFAMDRGDWQCGQDSNQNASRWPYQKKVWGCARNPPQYPDGTNL
ncbi:MAG: hypothetical protein GFH27_549319n92 [Chloroflexi bacterium AL-W]|nr:hypothetical protein [Chloroflexi bacterium AL-N1]NOK71255.1 hypothetical protein [Chloroflexi bacterium AL-N10]NOK77630.1 hypothetical protein [Chloroflexi bacterium AL-N5]NOK84481.1 hypothetical protein [Chloroflexi bacterium AL-W]NOK92932.1 hypothetical protein [Chloroflexi bacterium AL-N15]